MNSAVFLLEDANIYNKNRVAFQDEATALTFAELRNQAMSVGTAILNNIGNEAIIPIAVFLPKSVKCIVSFMGALYSGNPYVPIDYKMPPNRLQKVFNNLLPGIIITDENGYEILSRLNLPVTKVLLYSDIENTTPNQKEIFDRINSVIDTDPIYIKYTSGSTGEPKGVTIAHRSVIDYAGWVVDTFEYNEQTIMANQAPFYFDNSVFDIYGTLLCRGKMLIVPENLFLYPLKLPDYIVEHRVTSVFWVPTVLINIANSGVLNRMEFPFLNVVAFCGEVMPNKQLNIWRKAIPHPLYANLYGPTEITDVCTYYIVDREFADSEPLPIGKSCRNMRVVILNDENKESGISEIGELCVLGTGVALGYWNKRDITECVFIQNPLNPIYNETMYRTGDLAYKDENGIIFIKGRIDSQIKLKGNRIELGEIETAAASLSLIENACVLFNHETEDIILFVQADGQPSLRKLNIELSKHIPKYMLPTKLISLQRLPLTPNGKIDRVLLRETYID